MRVSISFERFGFGGILVTLYLLSGMTSLSYEVLWARMLSLQFGVSIFGTVVTVASFMAGLGIGSIVGTSWTQKTNLPLVFYGLLEVGIAVFALVLPWIFGWTDTWLAAVTQNASLTFWYVTQLSAAILLLLLPALAMGASFPFILQAIQPTDLSLGKIYGYNALGGALGAILPLWFLPMFGWLIATQFIAGIGIIIGVTAIFLAKHEIWASEVRTPKSLSCRSRKIFFSLLAYAGIGAAALMLEIGWTRLFGMILLRTEYVMAIILAVFLVGIGFGSLLAKRLTHVVWLTILPVIAGMFSIASLWLVPYVSDWVEVTRFGSLADAMFWQGMTITAMTLPVTLALGAWLPILSERLSNQIHAGAWLYGVNSIGAAIGALLAGFVLIPVLGTNGTVSLAAMMLLLCGLTWSNYPKARLVPVALGLFAIPVVKMPGVADLLPVSHANVHDVFIHEDAVSITHVIEDRDGQRLLLADLQRMDASTEPEAVEIQKNQARLPLLLHPNPRNILFLGLGTGISAAGSLPFPGLDRTAVELSKGAILAAQSWFTPVNEGVTKNMHIERDDARRFLMRDSGEFDVIIGDLFHPDLVGRSALLSVQQFQRVRDHLAAGGIFVQWIALNQFDKKSLDIVLRSFKHVFPDAMIFMDAFRLALTGSNGQFPGAKNMLSNVKRMNKNTRQLATGGEGVWTWLGRFWGSIPATSGSLQDEWAPRIEFQLPRARYNGELDLARLLADLLAKRPHVKDAAAMLSINKNDYPKFERAYIATDLAQRGWLASLQGQTQEEQKLLRLAFEANPQDRWIGFAIADRMYAGIDQIVAQGMEKASALQKILKVRPDHPEALKDLWQLEEKRGHAVQASEYRERFRMISPLSAALKTSG
jgi:spermidine synthase